MPFGLEYLTPMLRHGQPPDAAIGVYEHGRECGLALAAQEPGNEPSA